MALKYGTRLVVVFLFVVSTIVSSANLFFPQYANAKKDCDYSYYEDNSIPLYDPCQPFCGGGVDSAAQGGGFIEQKKLTGKTNKEKIYNFWIGQGLTPEQAAGITGSMQAEGGFSPFRQEISQTWPNGGYGIAQFTGSQRDNVTTKDPKYNLASLGDLYTKYYVNDYGGGAGIADDGVPDGVPVPVNDSFLLVELNYLGSWVSNLVPGTYSARISAAKTGGLPDVGDSKLLAYIKTLNSASDAAKAWTFLYEYPADIQATANVRAGFAAAILTEMTGLANSGNASCPSGINCPSSGSGDSTSVGDGSATAIVSAATCLSVTSGHKGGLDAYKACINKTAYEQPTTNYIAALDRFGIPSSCQNASSCATFVSVVLQLAGVDTYYSAGATDVNNNLKSHPDKYEYLGRVNSGNKGILKAGDIVAESGKHTMIVIADGATMMATASYNVPPDDPGRLPDQQPWWGSYDAYRVKK